MPLADPDLFWHLKTGQWTLQSGKLPGSDEDPFSYTSPGTFEEFQVQGLRSQWLGQVVLYLVYALGGYPGLVVFRSLLILIPFVIVYILAVRRGLSPLWAASVLSLPVLLIALSLQYSFERPQAFTFIFSFALIPLLERLRRPQGRWKWAFLLALMMALWSNLHGGFIFGVVMITVFSFGVLVEAAITRKREGLSVLAPAALGVAGSFLNPNTYHLLYSFIGEQLGRFVPVFSPAASSESLAVDIVGQILEYKPLWFFYKEFHFIWPLFMMAFMALVVMVVLVRYAAWRSIKLPQALLVAVIVLFSLYYSRGVVLSLVTLPLFAVSAAKDLGRFWRVASGALAAALCAVLLVVTVQRSPWQLRPAIPPTTWVDEVYPEGAVRFIRENGIKGPMFNDFLWGGYLIWKLHPEHKVFIDGRLISNPMFDVHMSVMNGIPSAFMELDAFGVNFVLVRIVNRESGIIKPLVLKLLEEEPGKWRLVFIDGDAALFVRNIPQNRHVIERYDLPYKVLYGPIYAEAEAILAMRPGHPNGLMSMAIALYGLERYQEAEAILRVLPPSPVRDRYLKKVQQGATLLLRGAP